MRGVRKAHQAGRLFLLAAVALGFALSSLDPRAAEHTPWHDHIVVGAHGLTEWAHALAFHRHEAARWDDPLLVAPQPVPADAGGARHTGPRVISIARLLGAGWAVFDINGQFPAGLNDLGRLQKPAGSHRVRAPRSHLLSAIPVPPLEPPPRISS